MPGWHEKTRKLQAEGKLVVLGITEEQHADRSELFMRWKQMDWPVLVDAFNLLEVKAVPLTYLIDESGVIRFKNPRPIDLTTFLGQDYPEPEKAPSKHAFEKDLERVLELVYSGDPSKLSEVVELNERRLKNGPSSGGRPFFQQGVLHRMRYDSRERDPGDFAKAIHWWGKALASNPGQYIWRRRMQQYGPRLDKPYPFYDWIETARKALIDRGEKPITLVAPVSGAEIARPGKDDTDRDDAVGGTHPDPDHKLPNDRVHVASNVVVVPATGQDRSAVRIHLHMELNPDRESHWNNEVEPPVFWLNDNDALVRSARARFVYPRENLPATSLESRTIELEVRARKGCDLPASLTGRLFYYACEGSTGTCMFLAQDIHIPIIEPQ